MIFYNKYIFFTNNKIQNIKTQKKSITIIKKL